MVHFLAHMREYRAYAQGEKKETQFYSKLNTNMKYGVVAGIFMSKIRCNSDSF